MLPIQRPVALLYFVQLNALVAPPHSNLIVFCTMQMLIEALLCACFSQTVDFYCAYYNIAIQPRSNQPFPLHELQWRISIGNYQHEQKLCPKWGTRLPAGSNLFAPLPLPRSSFRGLGVGNPGALPCREGLGG
jgi:hypothetical protein